MLKVIDATPGIGTELATPLYCTGRRVYVAGRSEEKANQHIKDIKAGTTKSSISGEVCILLLKLSPLITIKESAATFKSKELDCMSYGTMLPCHCSLKTVFPNADMS